MRTPCQVCEQLSVARGYCSRHYQRFMRYGNPLEPNHRGESLPKDVTGPNNPNYRGDRIGYSMAHHRVEAARGKPSEHGCVDCGAPAVDWSYDRSDPYERYSKRNGSPYSLDVERYVPRCQSCHSRVDHPKNRAN